MLWFLADRTAARSIWSAIGIWYVCLSVRLSVTKCIVAKRYILQKQKRLKRKNSIHISHAKKINRMTYCTHSQHQQESHRSRTLSSHKNDVVSRGRCLSACRSWTTYAWYSVIFINYGVKISEICYCDSVTSFSHKTFSVSQFSCEFIFQQDSLPEHRTR